MHILEEILHEGSQFMQYLQVYHQRFLQKKSSLQSKVHTGLGKIDYNRSSIAIFLTFFQSNTPDPLLFGMSIEYAVFFSFFQVKTIFDFFFQKAMQQQTSKHSKEDY